MADPGIAAGVEDAIEAGRLLFAQECVFVLGAAEVAQVPDSRLPEIAFAGRSNVGKSSLVNALVGHKALARTSNTPGRTQQINFFTLGGRLMLADLPGYGFAQAPKNMVKRWTNLVRTYLRGRASLSRVILLIDARRGIKDNDRDIMEMLDKAAVSYLGVLTKADKLGAAELEACRSDAERELAKRPAAHPEVIVTSSVDGRGVAELRAHLAALAAPAELH
jgi:GTP-binding protein